MASDSAYAQRWQAISAQAASAQHSPHKTANTLLHIPVVFHVIYAQPSEDLITEARLLSQLRVLNEDYQQLPGTPGASPGANMQLAFFIASQDPDGNCHSGINWVQSDLALHDADSDQAEADLKALSIWPTDRYLNIWVVDGFLDNSVLGYSSLPGEDAALDGVVIGRDYVGVTTGGSSDFALGRTGTHEVGHWLGLLHPFDDGCVGTTASTCPLQGDLVCDTPPMDEPTYTCRSTPPNSCTETPDAPDPHRNYMDYLPDACMDRFTPGQVARVRTLLDIHRSYIYSAENLALAGRGSQCAVTSIVDKQPASPVHLRSHAHAWEWTSTQGPEVYTVQILDGSGKTIRSLTLSSEKKAILERNEIPKGLYLASIYNRGRYVSSFRLLHP
jgi:hypothetical protein